MDCACGVCVCVCVCVLNAGLVSVPGSFSFNGDTAHISSSERRAIRDIIDSASVCKNLLYQ